MTFEELTIWVLGVALILLVILYLWVKSKGVDYWIHFWGWDENDQ